MPKVKIDGLEFDAPEKWSVLEVARFLGLEIPTLCYNEGLSAWGGCRLCLVEIGTGDRTKLVTSCTYPAEEGLVVKTSSKRVVNARKMVLELLIAQCPTSRTLQDLAAKMGLKQVRFKPKWEKCIYCGLCVRMCEEQMMAKAIGFTNRGNKLKINTPFNKTSDECRRCGACMYICPVCTVRCEGANPKDVLCGRCENSLQPTCIDINDSYNCWMGLKGECGTCAKEKLTVK
ncbi:MAG: 2Fe-2S iron-sulfur cluster-binding protein [Planctomycetota bacterium]|nr:2Fe-2S iron-sulfur cluster-binding protein [Planctomycetota bacterium]MDI6787567.1 2Fe-2S iron-sulfur cluster-binding protein [Planctomycetota bacterium]